jgi:prepilin-type N-terminal cleavage/methylation domain-containing protein
MIYFVIPMKTELKTKFLQHLAKLDRKNKGFSLIELLVTVVIIGILAAIAMPNFLKQVQRATQSEAQSYLGSVLRTQQTYRTEHGEFATAITQLPVRIPDETEKYTYTIDGATNQGTAKAEPKDTKLKGYHGMVKVIDPGQQDVTKIVICESDSAASVPQANIANDGTVSCVDGQPI